VSYSRLGRAAFGSVLVTMAAVVACSATGDDGLHGPRGGGPGNVGAGGEDFGIIGQGSGASGAVVGDGTCGVVQKPEQIIQYAPIALYIMLDRSGSMITGFPEGSAESWQNSTKAINAFVTDPSSQSIDVGLGFFPTAPDNGWTCSDGTGSGSNCGTPVVEIGAVSKTGPELTNAMSSNQPSPLNFTPTECGLMGMISHCEDWKKRTGEQCVAILVTDGNPTLCTADTAALSKIVADGKANGVTTFVLGLPGSNASILDPLAQAGGSNASIDVSGGVSAFVTALNTIRGKVSVGTALPCQWKIPPTPAGQQFDPQKVNVRFTPKGGSPQDFGYVAQADCSRASNAWYFDNPNQPTQVFVCPTTCDMLKASAGAEVDVAFGCATKPAALR
jgi:hypothetical protein